ncbi:MAG: bis-aminopropyl spermidine synthase family protein [Chloroflexi bacterium]|nr:bis-aminopropyl spermidine synthase family protein [Chloroflexota bacterium]
MKQRLVVAPDLERRANLRKAVAREVPCAAPTSSRAAKPTNLSSRFGCYQNSDEDREIGALIQGVRPTPLREFDQIPMKAPYLLRQARAVAPLLEARTIAFVGDADCTSLVLGLLATRGGPRPTAMLLLDFDCRLLAWARTFANRQGFGDLLAVQAYNVFDPLPAELAGQFDWFYTNPPYGAANEGLSARIFLSRGMELADRTAGQGCTILPCDRERPWTQQAWSRTKRFVRDYGWAVTERVDGVHRYYLDDDPNLASSVILMRRLRQRACSPLPLQGRRVEQGQVPDFYGRTVKPPYPRYIREDGSKDFDWDNLVEAAG